MPLSPKMRSDPCMPHHPHTRRGFTLSVESDTQGVWKTSRAARCAARPLHGRVFGARGPGVNQVHLVGKRGCQDSLQHRVFTKLECSAPPSRRRN